MIRTYSFRTVLIFALLGCGALNFAVAQNVELPNLFGGPFSLTDHDGNPVTDRSWPNKKLLIYFGYTRCPDLCPINLQTMATAIKNLGPQAAAIQPIFVSVDPGRDSPVLIRKYVKYFHPRMIGLTGTETQITEVSKAYRLHRRKVVIEADQQNYLVDHGSITYLMAEDGGFLTLFPHDTSAEKMLEVLKTYL